MTSTINTSKRRSQKETNLGVAPSVGGGGSLGVAPAPPGPVNLGVPGASKHSLIFGANQEIGGKQENGAKVEKSKNKGKGTFESPLKR